MAEYIDKEAAIETAKHAWAKGLEPSQYIEIIQAAGVAQVQHGRWVHTDYAIHWTAKDECSECTYHALDRNDLSHYNYCPNCGAKMDLKD